MEGHLLLPGKEKGRRKASICTRRMPPCCDSYLLQAEAMPAVIDDGPGTRFDAFMQKSKTRSMLWDTPQHRIKWQTAASADPCGPHLYNAMPPLHPQDGRISGNRQRTVRMRWQRSSVTASAVRALGHPQCLPP